MPAIFFAGDVMLGRGVDQLFAHRSRPELVERWVHDARDYVKLVESRSGPIATPVSPSYPWGELLEEMRGADARIVNLETSITSGGLAWPGKAVHYRMHPANVAALSTAHIDACTLANNHVLDFGHEGLADTLEALRGARIASCGAGRTRDEAQAPAIVPLPSGRALVFSFGSTTSGIPASWEALPDRAGVDLLPDLSIATAERIAERMRAHARPGDVVIASIHWGTNYGWGVDAAVVSFAHALIDGGVDVVHGHSSHHPRPLERHRGKLVLYGCGDLLNDYEGIEPDEEFRVGLGLGYFATLDARGDLEQLRMLPLRVRRMRLAPATLDDARFLAERIGQVDVATDATLWLRAS
jgi:poly-gamma-glutamate synthesis protein (capsule biosynthesis protein)